MKKPEEKNKAQWKHYLIEAGKWAFVVWLFLPLQNRIPDTYDFTRVVLGIVLFIIFTGKMLFDAFFSQRTSRSTDTSLKKELVSLLGIIAVLAVAVGSVLFLAGFLLISMYERMMNKDG